MNSHNKQFDFLKFVLFNQTQKVREILEQAKPCDKTELLSCSDLNKNTALLLAAKYGGPELVALLLEQGADPYVQDSEYSNLLHQAVRNEKAQEVCEVILAHVNCEPLWTQISNLADTVFDIALSSSGCDKLLKTFIQQAKTLPTLESFALSTHKTPYHRSTDIPLLIQDKIKALQEKEVLETTILIDNPPSSVVELKKSLKI